MMDANRRRRSRVELNLPAGFLRRGGTNVPILICNISLKGLLAMPEAAIRTGETGQVRIALAQDAHIAIDSKVIRSDATGVAIDFMPMDEQSFLHLRNLVRYNAPDADRIDEELQRPAFD
jgi:hypothetical protein